MKRFVIDGNAFTGSYHAKILHNVLYSDPVEVICLTTGQDGREYLMFLCSGKDEDCMCRRFLKSLKESIECRLREHMHLIYNIYTISSNLRRYAHLVHEGLYILYTIIRRSIKFMDAVRTSFCK